MKHNKIDQEFLFFLYHRKMYLYIKYSIDLNEAGWRRKCNDVIDWVCATFLSAEPDVESNPSKRQRMVLL